MKVKIVYFVWFSGLLFAILAAVIHEGERIVRSLDAAGGRADVQDVRVVNGWDDALPVSIQRRPDAAMTEHFREQVSRWDTPVPSSSAH